MSPPLKKPTQQQTSPKKITSPNIKTQPSLFGLEWIEIPAGEFWMGAVEEDKDAYNYEKPGHTLYLTHYWISKTPITNAQYAPFVQTGKVEPPKHWQGDKPPKERLEHPVVYVSWEDSIAYCDRLGERLKLDVTLPSEAEWEKAAGWDAQKGQKLIYPWGNKYRKGYCNDSNGKVGGTSPVTQFAQGASPYGLLDMAGNVSEWTRSHWAPSAKLGVAFFRPDYKYPYDVSDGRENLSDRKAWRVLRGGSFNYGPGFQRVSYRLRHNIDLRLGYLGFRVVVRPPSQ